MNKRLQDLWQDTLIFWYAVYLRLINTLIRPLPPAPPPSHNHKGAVVATRTTHQPASSNQPNSNILPAYPSNGINSAASTETPLDTQPPIPTSTSTVKVVQRPTPENAFQRNQTLNCPLVRPRLQTPTSSNNYVHRRCASAVPPHNTLTTQLKGDFSRDSNSAAATLRNAILRKEAANVAIHLKTWNPHKDLILVDAEGFNLIHSAASIHSPEILSLVLNAINTPELKSRAAQSPGKNPNRYTPLHIASLKSDVDSSRILIQAGADPNARSKLNSTPLHLAVNKGSLELVKLLLNAGADPNVETRVGNLPLMVAVHKKSAALVEVLLRAGANPHTTPESVSCSVRAKSVVEVATELGMDEIRKMFDSPILNS